MPDSSSIGQRLKHARTAKKLTIKQVTKSLHIRESYLEAIEKDLLEELPSPVQGRGFIRLYWSHLGLDEQELEELLRPPAPPEPEPTAVDVPAEPAPADLAGRLKGWVTRIRPGVKTTPPAEIPVPPPAPTPQEPAPAFRRKPAPLPTRSELALDAESPAEPDRPPRPSDEVIAGIGAQLREQRERLSLSLDNIETYTHIPAHYLRALENGRIDQLPSPVQGRGMLSNYASFLDLDVDAILLQYADSLQLRREEMEQAAEPDKKKRTPPKVVKPGSIRTLFSLDVVLVGLLMIVAFVALIWGAGSIMAYRSAGVTPTERPISELLIQTATLTETQDLSETLLPVTDTPLPQAPVVVNLSGTPILTPTTSGTPPTQAVYSVNVFIVAAQRAYLQVNVDGKPAFNGRTIPGNPYTFSGNSQIEVTSGNAAALQITYNGQSMGTLGNNGAVIHLIFGLEGYGTPTLTPTNTATETLRPSRTPKPSNTYPPTRTKTYTATAQPSSTPKPTHTPLAAGNP